MKFVILKNKIFLRKGKGLKNSKQLFYNCFQIIKVLLIIVSVVTMGIHYLSGVSLAHHRKSQRQC